MVAEVLDMDVIIPMVVTQQGIVTLVGLNPLRITNVTMHTDTSLTQHGELVVMALDKTIEVLEVEKVW